MTHKLWRQRLRVVEVPIIFTDRFQGHSKMSGHIVREALIMVWRLWFQNKCRRRPTGAPPPSPPGESSRSNPPEEKKKDL
jgi:dolichol-phosphate mannosyltransferase